ncbi:MAG: hypothetical protein ACT4PT_07180 [Methanobacteriota archaeon]
MSGDPAAASLLDAARRQRDDLAARLLLAAAVQRVADELGIQAVVTGGTAVDFYAAGAAGTSAAYPFAWRASGDVDVVAVATRGGRAGAIDLQRALVRDLGLEPAWRRLDASGREVWSRGLLVPDFGFGLEVVGDELFGDRDAERVLTVEVEGQPVVLRGPEDVVLAYAESGFDTWHKRDWERALAVFAAMRDEIDLAYLRRRAGGRGIAGVLEEVVEGRPLEGERRRMY